MKDGKVNHTTSKGTRKTIFNTKKTQKKKEVISPTDNEKERLGYR